MADQWQQFRFLVWPLIVGAATVQCMYITLWTLVSTKLRKEHAVACVVSGVFAFVFAVTVANQWNNSSTDWVMFTIGLCILAGVLITTAGLLVARIWKEN